MKRILFGAAALFLFSASVQAQTIYMEEDFENGMPTEWTQSTLASDGGWLAGTGTSLSSQYFTITNHTGIIATNDDGCNCDKSADSLFTDTIDLTSASGFVVLEFDMYYAQAVYQGAVENLDFYVHSITNNTVTQVFDAPAENSFYWKNGELVNLSSFAGQEIRIVIVYGDGGDWLYGAALDNVTVYESNTMYDVANNSVDNGLYLEVNTSTNIEGTIKNNGGATITDLEIAYTVDGGSPVTATISGLSIAPLSFYSFTHPTAWTPSTAQTSTIVTNIVSINGNNDENPGDNTATTDVIVHEPGVQRKPLIESFTSSTCAPCAPGNVNVKNVITPYDGEYSIVKYQMSWPGTGDPYYTAEGQTRREFYSVNSVPAIFTDGAEGVNGFNSNSYVDQDISSRIDAPAYVEMEATAWINPVKRYTVENGELTVTEEGLEVTVEGLAKLWTDLPQGQRFYTAVVENLTDNNVKTNGETEFEAVLKKMLPNAGGNALSAISEGDSIFQTESFIFPGEYRLPNNANDPIDLATEHSVEEFDDLSAVIWIQNPSNRNVWQSETVEITYSEDTISNLTVEEIDGVMIYTVDGTSYEMFGDNLVPQGAQEVYAANVSLYPNPANDHLTIDGVGRNTNVKIFDAMGRMVSNSTVNNHDLINVSTFDAGIYNVVIESNGNTIAKRIAVTH